MKDTSPRIADPWPMQDNHPTRDDPKGRGAERTRDHAWSGTRWVAYKLESEIRKADAAGEVWTEGLASKLSMVRVSMLPAEGGMARRLRRRAYRMIEGILHAKDPESLSPMLAFRTEEIDALVSEHARCLTEAQIRRLEGEHIVGLLRNRSLAPETLVSLIRCRIAHQAVAGGPGEIDFFRAALSLPAPIKEAGWAGARQEDLAEWWLRPFATPHPDPALIAEIADEPLRTGRIALAQRSAALSRPDLSDAMIDRLLGGEPEMCEYIGERQPSYNGPSLRALRRALQRWPSHVGVAHRVALSPEAPLDLVREIVRDCPVGGDLMRGLAEREDVLADPEIRAALLAEPKTHPVLVFEATDEEFPQLFRSTARDHPELALDALDVRLGSGRPHGLAPDDLAPVFAAGGRLAEWAMGLLAEVRAPCASAATTGIAKVCTPSGVRR